VGFEPRPTCTLAFCPGVARTVMCLAAYKFATLQIQKIVNSENAVCFHPKKRKLTKMWQKTSEQWKQKDDRYLLQKSSRGRTLLNDAVTTCRKRMVQRRQPGRRYHNPKLGQPHRCSVIGNAQDKPCCNQSVYFCRVTVRVDCASSRPEVDDTLRPAPGLCGRRSGGGYDAEVLSVWWHSQRRQPHGVHWKTYVQHSWRRHFPALYAAHQFVICHAHAACCKKSHQHLMSSLCYVLT